MSFTIRALVLYGYGGEKRVVHFREHGLNIVTGASKTGKSAIIDIIDYCLGRGSYEVAEGFIRQRVAWFGLHLARGGDEVFVARDNPGPAERTGSKVYIQRGAVGAYPPLKALEKNTTEDSLKEFVTRFAGIEENEHRPASGTRKPLEANIAHALFLCFQKQGTIASQDQLFHRMNEQFLPQSMKDTLPYFLGSAGKDHFLHLAELDRLREKLRKLKAEEVGRLRVIDAARSRVARIVSEGKRVGLIERDYAAVDDTVFDFLRGLLDREIGAPEIIPDFGDTIASLRGEQAALRRNLRDLARDVRAAQEFLDDQTDFSREAREQRARLKSLGLYKDAAGGATSCPICDSTLPAPLPKVADMDASLARLDDQLDAVGRDSPHLHEHIAKLHRRRDKAEEALRAVNSDLALAMAEDQNASAAQDHVVAQAHFIGRLSNFLETMGSDGSADDRSKEIAETRRAVAALREKLNADDAASRLQTRLDFIGAKMTKYSERLDLEYSGSQLRLDLRNLTVVANTEDGPVPLQRMGSGENWVGYHVIALLALHWWLRRRARPVPGFLVFDQPTQTHYPADVVTGGLEEAKSDDDRVAVKRLFELMRDACAEIEPPFQLIVLDHAHLGDDWFGDAIVEEWRDGKALVPREWRGPDS